MSDRYQELVQSPLGQLIVSNLGLPNPPRLARYREGAETFPGRVLHGAADGSTLADAVVESFDELGIASTETEVQAEDYKGLVFDATGIVEPAGLDAVQQFFTPVLRSLTDCARI